MSIAVEHEGFILAAEQPRRDIQTETSVKATARQQGEAPEGEGCPPEAGTPRREARTASVGARRLPKRVNQTPRRRPHPEQNLRIRDGRGRAPLPALLSHARLAAVCAEVLIGDELDLPARPLQGRSTKSSRPRGNQPARRTGLRGCCVQPRISGALAGSKSCCLGAAATRLGGKMSTLRASA